MDYKQSGVDIEAGYEVVSRVKKLARSTFTKGVLGDIGYFGGLFQIDKNEFKEPVLVSGTDGVGTKLKIAFLTDKHDTIGIDAVAMCVNDVVVLGAKPLFFLDYLAMNKVDPDVAEDLLKGIAEGCRQSCCALIGGETAEMSDLYGKDEYDIAGFCVGIVEKSKIINGSTIKAGDKLIGIASSGLHSNGYSLARKVLLDMAGFDVNSKDPALERTVGEEMLEPTKIYVRPILELIKEFEIKGMAHITGGGLPENAARFLPVGCDAVFDASAWPKPAIFSLIEGKGSISKEEMYKTFNMGLGMVLAVKPEIAGKVIKKIDSLGEKAYMVGEITKGAHKVIVK
ncbi:MAG: phosphoribosylformylglycinamidine cyclo-ligase [Candidatus Saganbacteria bacterium]|nr:phosphoribosylformylglycinamidine cyclo-ligase [Candidatus Saganbacteria bacterium]